MKTLVLDAKRLKKEQRVMKAYAEEYGSTGNDLTFLGTFIKRNATLIPQLIADGYLSIQEVDEAEFTQKAKSA